MEDNGGEIEKEDRNVLYKNEVKSIAILVSSVLETRHGSDSGDDSYSRQTPTGYSPTLEDPILKILFSLSTFCQKKYPLS